MSGFGRLRQFDIGDRQEEDVRGTVQRGDRVIEGRKGNMRGSGFQIMKMTKCGQVGE